MPYKFKRISQTKANKILRCFASDISATQAAKLAGANRNTINHLKECEFRYNHKDDILKMLQKITRDLLV